MDRSAPEEALGRALDTAERASPVDAVEAVTHEVGVALGALAVSFLIADLSGRGLVRLARVALGERGALVAGERWDGEDLAVTLPFDGGPAERVTRAQRPEVVPNGGTWTVFAPVSQRGEMLGVLEMVLPYEPGPDVLVTVGHTAHVLAFVLIANRRHTDLFEWGQRSTEFSLPAEIQRRLLPSAFTCEASPITLSAWLEPAADIGGDTFDYSLERNLLHLSVTDAMGHGIGSALAATVCVGSLRKTRRQGRSLLEQVADANAALCANPHGDVDEGFVTGLIGRLHLGSGVLSLVNAGHVPPYLARGGDVETIELPRGLPLGLFAEATYGSTDLRLEPGDRLVIVTDGMVERNASTLDLAEEIRRCRHLHPREATRYLADAVLDHAGSRPADDATLLVLDWLREAAASGPAGVTG